MFKIIQHPWSIEGLFFFKSISVLRFVSELQRYLAVQHVTEDRVQTESSVLISCVS